MTARASLQVGGSIGLAVLVTVALRHTASRVADGVAPAVAATDGYSLAIKIGAFVMLAGAALVALLFERVKFIPPEELALEAVESAAGAVPVGGPTLGSGAVETAPAATGLDTRTARVAFRAPPAAQATMESDPRTASTASTSAAPVSVASSR